MKAIMKTIISLCIICFLPFFLLSCGEEHIEYTIKVVSQNETFSGYYFCDDGATQAFVSGALVSSTGIYDDGSCEDPEDEIRLYAVTDSQNATSLEAFIYKEGKKVDEADGVRIDGNSSNPYEVSITYKITSTESGSE